jgi:putative chitinase
VNLTSDLLVYHFHVLKNHADEYVPLLNALNPKYEISNGYRFAGFLSQIMVESEYFSRVTENLDYPAASLLRVFPSHFDSIEAVEYSHSPIKIANRVYADRMGNGNEASGDGYRYRGMGLIQLTGKWMHEKYAQYAGKMLEDVGAYLQTPEGALDSACWFWSVLHNLNPLADTASVSAITRVINGGLNGLQTRLDLYNSLIVFLNK